MALEGCGWSIYALRLLGLSSSVEDADGYIGDNDEGQQETAKLVDWYAEQLRDQRRATWNSEWDVAKGVLGKIQWLQVPGSRGQLVLEKAWWDAVVNSKGPYRGWSYAMRKQTQERFLLLYLATPSIFLQSTRLTQSLRPLKHLNNRFRGPLRTRRVRTTHDAAVDHMEVGPRVRSRHICGHLISPDLQSETKRQTYKLPPTPSRRPQPTAYPNF